MEQRRREKKWNEKKKKKWWMWMAVRLDSSQHIHAIHASHGVCMYTIMCTPMVVSLNYAACCARVCMKHVCMYENWKCYATGDSGIRMCALGWRSYSIAMPALPSRYPVIFSIHANRCSYKRWTSNIHTSIRVTCLNMLERDNHRASRLSSGSVARFFFSSHIKTNLVLNRFVWDSQRMQLPKWRTPIRS